MTPAFASLNLPVLQASEDACGTCPDQSVPQVLTGRKQEIPLQNSLCYVGPEALSGFAVLAETNALLPGSRAHGGGRGWGREGGGGKDGKGAGGMHFDFSDTEVTPAKA